MKLKKKLKHSKNCRDAFEYLLENHPKINAKHLVKYDENFFSEWIRHPNDLDIHDLWTAFLYGYEHAITAAVHLLRENHGLENDTEKT